MIRKPLPTFIVGGGIRCATGWIRECLSEHPEVYMQPKETHFFDQHFEESLEWYSQFFTEHGNKQIIGEKTASYLHDNTVADKIKKTIPDIKLVFCLRDPVARMYSHYTMLASSDEELRKKGFLTSINDYTKFAEWGKYYKQLTPYLSNFPNKNILIQIYEDMESDPYSFMSRIYHFINTEPSFKAPSTKVRTKLGRFEHNSLFWNWLSRIMLNPKAPFLMRSIYSKIRPNETRNILTEELYLRFADYYKDDIIKLENILGRELSIWPIRRYI